MGIFEPIQKLSWHTWGWAYDDKEKKIPLGKTLYCYTPEYNRVSVNTRDLELAERDGFANVLFRGNNKSKLVPISKAVELYEKYSYQLNPGDNYRVIPWDVILGTREDVYFSTDGTEPQLPAPSNMKEVEFVRNDNVDWALGIELDYPLGNSKMKTLIHAMELAGVSRITIDIGRGVFLIDKS